MSRPFKFGDSKAISVRNALRATGWPIDYMRQLHGNRLSLTCGTCRWMDTRLALGLTTHVCLKYPAGAPRKGLVHPAFGACGAHEPRPKGIPS